VQLRRREMTVLNTGRFGGSGVWHVPERPTLGNLDTSRNTPKTLSFAAAGNLVRALSPEFQTSMEPPDGRVGVASTLAGRRRQESNKAEAGLVARLRVCGFLRVQITGDPQSTPRDA
jgi:hypothetical protein